MTEEAQLLKEKKREVCSELLRDKERMKEETREDQKAEEHGLAGQAEVFSSLGQAKQKVRQRPNDCVMSFSLTEDDLEYFHFRDAGQKTDEERCR